MGYETPSFSIDTNGVISIQGDLSVETFVGTFSLDANVSASLKSEDNTLILLIRHQENGSVVDTEYKIQTGQDDVKVVTNGRTIVDVTQHKVFIDASNGSIQSIEVKDANSESTSTSPSQVPTPTPTPVPTNTLTPVLPQIVQLNSSYSGDTVNSGYRYPMNMYIDSESTQGKLRARIYYSGLSVSSYACIGNIGSNNRLTLTCQNMNARISLLLSGVLYQDGHMQGIDSANGSWYLT